MFSCLFYTKLNYLIHVQQLLLAILQVRFLFIQNLTYRLCFLDCTSCTAITEQTGGTASPTIVEGTTNGCTTYTVSCTGPTGGDAVLDFYSGGTSVGVSGPETGTITRVVTCSTTGELILTEEGNEISVDTVQCVAI